MGAFDDLLRVQERDTAADQLRHRRDSLPERRALIELGQAIARHDKATAAIQGQRDEIARAQRRIEDEVAGIEEKVTSETGTLYSGSVTSPRELQAIQEEIDALGRRQRQLEDQVIELMEQAEPLDGELETAQAARADLDRQVAGAQASMAASEAAIDEELASVEAERDEARAGVADDLLARYDKMRPQYGGVAVARLVGSSCGGCHLVLSAVELDRIRHQPPDALVTCQECGRLLVR